MAGNTDFIEMFQELGLSANCSLDEFKRAYRRCVAQLHPDRAGNRVTDQSRLQRLTVTYDAALEFHRRYGRLPGYITQPVPPRHRAGLDAAPASRPPPSRRSRLRYLILALLGLVLLAWILSDVSPPVEEEAPEQAPEAAPALAESLPVLPVARPAPPRLVPGMSKREVEALEGAPDTRSESEWYYGPSVIFFKCGQVDNWYSSAMRPLKFASPHPSAVDLARAPIVTCASTDPTPVDAQLTTK